MSAHLTSGPARVVAAGTVTTWYGHPLELVAEVDGVSVRVVVRFEEGPAPRVASAPLDDGWSLTLHGFDDPSGRGSAEPVLLGAVGDALLFLHFRAFRFGATADRTLHYTLHRVAQAEVGWRDTSRVP